MTTAVDPTWQEITIEAGDWEVQTLGPASEIESQQEIVGSSIDLGSIVEFIAFAATSSIGSS